jgi:SAM-dependent methyltransferase
VVLGKPRAVPSYSWDNAYGERPFAVRAFDVSKFPISHGEWLAFIVAGGYQTPRYWSEAGWAWRTSRNAKAPAFWVPDGPAGSNLYRFRLLFDVVDMPWSWPVSVNYFEAKAYCAWLTEREGEDKAYRLISEAEHHRIRPRGAATDAANLELSFGSESPVDAFPPGFEGVHDARGNVWTWCEDHYAALAGFAPDPLYDDFSTPCFDGKHQLILGGSFVSTGNEASVWARFHFRPHFHQHAGFRLVRSAHALQKSCADAPPPHVGGKPCCTNLPAVASPYDTTELLFQYLTLHFATAAETAPGPIIHPDVVNFPRRTAEAISAAAARYGVETSRALDIGCAVGGASFELGRVFREVIGVDLSESFVSTARTLQRDGRFPYSMRMEGDLLLPMEAVVDAALDRGRVSFRQADACSLPADLGSFDAVLSSNLLCRLPSPGALLGRLGGPRGLVKPGGLLLNISPWSWMENFTPKSAWLGGSVVDGSARRSSDGLAEALRGEFELLETYDFPLIIREHARKFQYITPEATLWRRRRTP